MLILKILYCYYIENKHILVLINLFLDYSGLSNQKAEAMGFDSLLFHCGINKYQSLFVKSYSDIFIFFYYFDYFIVRFIHYHDQTFKQMR
jgi:hypothetical protein